MPEFFPVIFGKKNIMQVKFREFLFYTPVKNQRAAASFPGQDFFCTLFIAGNSLCHFAEYTDRYPAAITQYQFANLFKALFIGPSLE
jgi:hypothetical protein